MDLGWYGDAVAQSLWSWRSHTPARRSRGDLEALQAKQDAALALTSSRPITTPEEAESFLGRVGLALRYGPTKGLPMASLYRALGGPAAGRAAQTRAIALTNQLLGEARAIEVHVIAGRVTLVHRSLMPALYALVRRGRPLDDLEGLSLHARTAHLLLREQREVTAGDVRRRLGLRSDPRNDPAYAALGELEHVLLVDRGPFEMPRSGIAYLSREGYPHHLFHEAHPELVAASRKYTAAAAADGLLQAYLDGAVFARLGKLSGLFKAFLSPAEIEASVQRLSGKGKVEVSRAGRDTIVRRVPDPSARRR